MTGTRPPGRISPPTERVTRVLTLLADTPRERRTLTEIAAGLDLNKPTCLGILTALADEGFVTRDETKRYGLGPALLRLGSAAESGLATIDLVRPHLDELHDRLGMSCILTAVHGDHVVILDRCSLGTAGDRRDLVGERFPCAPPLGLANVAWEHDTVVDAWLARPPLAPLAAGDRTVRTLVAGARERGYIVESYSSSTTSSLVLANLLGSGMPQPVIDQILGFLPPVDWSEFIATMPDDRAALLPVANIGAPIFDRRGRQQYTLTLIPERTDATAGQCLDWAEEVERTTRTATNALRGG